MLKRVAKASDKAPSLIGSPREIDTSAPPPSLQFESSPSSFQSLPSSFLGVLLLFLLGTLYLSFLCSSSWPPPWLPPISPCRAPGGFSSTLSSPSGPSNRALSGSLHANTRSINLLVASDTSASAYFFLLFSNASSYNALFVTSRYTVLTARNIFLAGLLSHGTSRNVTRLLHFGLY